MNKRWLTWGIYYILVIAQTISDCWKTLNHHTIESYEALGNLAIAALMSAFVFSVFWSLGLSLIIMSIADRLEVWLTKLFKAGEPIRLLSFEFLRRQ